MLKILVVEDEQEKKRLIIEAIMTEPEISMKNIDIEGDVYGAKTRLKIKQYDLLILDINIPPRADQKIQNGAGLDILKYIKKNLQVKQPKHIIGMTAYDEAFESALNDFNASVFKIIKFDYSEVNWRDALLESIQYLVSHDTPPYHNDGFTYHVDVGVVCALEEEFNAIRELGTNWEEISVPYDSLAYYKGCFGPSESEISVVAVVSPNMGMPIAAVVATKLISTFRPSLLAMTGICAGVRGKTDYGDILIADPCFDWGSGKWVADSESSTLKFRPAPYPWRLEASLRAVVKHTADTTGVIDTIYNNFTNDKPSSPPKVIVNAMASGGSVLQANVLMDDVREQHKNLVGVEMESYAVLTAVAYSDEPHPKCITIKSVCDFGDEDKDDSFHDYACYTSAQFFYHFVLNVFSEVDD